MLCVKAATGQKPFTEGIILYKVELTTPDNTTINGVYIFYVKDADLKKELRLDNGYEDIILINCAKKTAYNLQNSHGKKFAIEMSMDDLLQKQQKYLGFMVESEADGGNKLAGCAAVHGKIMYKDSSRTDIMYTKEWRPLHGVTFNRFPDAAFFPLSFSYIESSGIAMKFNAEKMDAGPVSSSVFAIPKDYKMISYQEYKQLIKE